MFQDSHATTAAAVVKLANLRHLGICHFQENATIKQVGNGFMLLAQPWIPNWWCSRPLPRVHSDVDFPLHGAFALGRRNSPSTHAQSITKLTQLF